MIRDHDLEASARQQLTRLIDQIDVDAPLPVDEPHRAAWARPMVTVAAGLGLVTAGVIAAEVSDRGSQPPVEAAAPEPTRTILWSSGDPPDFDPREDWDCPPEYLPEGSCSFMELASVDGRQVLSGIVWGNGAEEQVPATIHLRYGVYGQVDELTIDVTPGEVNGGELEWSAEIPGHIPLLVDPETARCPVPDTGGSLCDRGRLAVDFFEIAELDLHGNSLGELGVYSPGHQPT